MKSEIDLYIIGRVKEMRIKAKMSQRTLSEILDRSLGFVGQAETPNCPAKYSVHQLYIIANEFNCSVSDFFPPVNVDEN